MTEQLSLHFSTAITSKLDSSSYPSLSERRIRSNSYLYGFGWQFTGAIPQALVTVNSPEPSSLYSPKGLGHSGGFSGHHTITNMFINWICRKWHMLWSISVKDMNSKDGSYALRRSRNPLHQWRVFRVQADWGMLEHSFQSKRQIVVTYAFKIIYYAGAISRATWTRWSSRVSMAGKKHHTKFMTQHPHCPRFPSLCCKQPVVND